MSKKILIFFHFVLKTFVICQRRNGRAESASAESSRRRIVSAPNGLGAESSQRRISRAETAAPNRPRRKVDPLYITINLKPIYLTLKLETFHPVGNDFSRRFRWCWIRISINPKFTKVTGEGGGGKSVNRQVKKNPFFRGIHFWEGEGGRWGVWACEAVGSK